MKHLMICLAALLLVSVAGCSTNSSISKSGALDASAKWALLPMTNHTDTPQAALSAEAIAEHFLRRRGIGNLIHYPATLTRDTLFEPSERRVVDDAQKWAREQGASYGVLGAVEEWRYKVGIDGEPAVGITLQVIDLSNGAVLWSSSGAKSGWSRTSLAHVAHNLLESLLGDLPIANVATAAIAATAPTTQTNAVNAPQN